MPSLPRLALDLTAHGETAQTNLSTQNIHKDNAYQGKTSHLNSQQLLWHYSTDTMFGIVKKCPEMTWTQFKHSPPYVERSPQGFSGPSIQDMLQAPMEKDCSFSCLPAQGSGQADRCYHGCHSLNHMGITAPKRITMIQLSSLPGSLSNSNCFF